MTDGNLGSLVALVVDVLTHIALPESHMALTLLTTFGATCTNGFLAMFAAAHFPVALGFSLKLLSLSAAELYVPHTSAFAVSLLSAQFLGPLHVATALLATLGWASAE